MLYCGCDRDGLIALGELVVEGDSGNMVEFTDGSGVFLPALCRPCDIDSSSMVSDLAGICRTALVAKPDGLFVVRNGVTFPAPWFAFGFDRWDGAACRAMRDYSGSAEAAVDWALSLTVGHPDFTEWRCSRRVSVYRRP